MPLPTILSGNVASALGGAYEVANSVRMNGDARMYITPSAGDRDKWTFSCWVKRSVISSGSQTLFSAKDGSNNMTEIRFNSDDTIDFYSEDGSGGFNGRLNTNRLFRDPAAWLNVVAVWDSENGTAGNRMRLYINGTEETSFGTDTNPSDGDDSYIGANIVHTVGDKGDDSQNFKGYMAEVYYCNGQAYAASDFGEFDEDSPTIWKPKDASGLTFGTGGFYLDFEASGNLGNDANGGTDLTESGLAAADQALDSPTNNFCVLNPLDNFWIHSTFSEGNCQIVTDSADYGWNTGTIAVSNGKWYYECKVSEACNTTETLIGIGSYYTTSATAALGSTADDYGYYGAGHIRTNNGNAISSLSTYTANDIISVAFDLDNNKFYVRKNGGSWENSGDPTSGATGTGAQSITASGSQTVANNISGYFPAIADYDSTDGGTYQVNFGGCSAFTVSSGNADGNGYGNFEYAPPTGYYALCTKNLAEFG